MRSTPYVDSPAKCRQPLTKGAHFKTPFSIGRPCGPLAAGRARKKEKGDVYVVWLQKGIRNEEARKLAEENDIFFVQDHCLYHEYRNIYLMDE